MTDDILVKMRNCESDPMWADHAEVPKLWCKQAADEIGWLRADKDQLRAEIEELRSEIGEFKIALNEKLEPAGAKAAFELWLDTAWPTWRQRSGPQNWLYEAYREAFDAGHQAGRRNIRE